MTITRLNHFNAKPGRGGAVLHLLQAVVQTVRELPGCRSCQLLQALDETDRLVIVEVWDSVAAHQAAAKVIPPSRVQEVVALLAAPAAGASYRPIDAADA